MSQLIPREKTAAVKERLASWESNQQLLREVRLAKKIKFYSLSQQRDSVWERNRFKTATNRTMCMGVDHGGTRIWSGGTLMQIVPPPHRFCHIGTKMSVLLPSKYANICFRPGLCPADPAGGAHDAPPDPLVSWIERGHPSPYPTPLGTDPPSALAMRPPRSPARSTPMTTWVCLWPWWESTICRSRRVNSVTLYFVSVFHIVVQTCV